MAARLPLRSRTFDFGDRLFFARQDHVFDAAAEAVLGLGNDYLDQFQHILGIETKATRQINGCLLLGGVISVPVAYTQHFVVVQVERVTRWAFQTRYKVTVHWGISDESIAPVLRMCDPEVEISTSGPARSEPLPVWLSKRSQKQVVGLTSPDYFVTLQINDGEFVVTTCLRQV
jgi:hypothetical protein